MTHHFWLILHPFSCLTRELSPLRWKAIPQFRNQTLHAIVSGNSTQAYLISHYHISQSYEYDRGWTNYKLNIGYKDIRISKCPLVPYSVFRRCCPMKVYVTLPFWRKECLMALAASPSSEDMKSTSLMYSHTMATWALRYMYEVFATVRHRLIIWMGNRGCQLKP